jgi:hypothetical protein
MVAKCANPKCNCKFRRLSEGRLYLLLPSDASHSMGSTKRLTEYSYWLCPECSTKYTISRVGSAVLVSEQRSCSEKYVSTEAA